MTLCGAYWIPSEEEILIIKNYYTKKSSIKIVKEHYMTICQLWSPMFKFLIPLFLILLIAVILIAVICHRERQRKLSYANCIMLGYYMVDFDPLVNC